MKIALLTTTLFVLLAATAGAGETRSSRRASFSAKPRVTKPNGKYVISFAAANPTDCAVYVLDSQGRVVRHLAAGVLGEKPPAPFKKGLSQQLSWHGEDDNGRPASGGPFKVRVALGIKPTFEKTVGEAPGAIAGVAALAVNPASGELHVFNVYGNIHPSDGTTFCAVYDRKGKYLRTIMPYPGTLPESRLKGARRIDVDGRKVPYVYQGETRSLLPGLGNLPPGKPCVAPDGRVAFIGHHEFGTYNGAGPQQVVFVNADGSPPASGWTGPVLAKRSSGGGSLAITSDGKTLYATGIVEGRGSKAKAVHCVYKFAWGAKRAEVFVGDGKSSGNGKNRLSSPRSVSLDGQGNVYVADRGNGRIVAFKPDGSYLGEVKLAAVDQVEVHPKTRVIYATAGTKGKRELVKFASIKASTPACRTRVPLHRKDTISMLALDPSAQPSAVWYTHPRNKFTGGFKALRVVDKGGSFGDGEPLVKMVGKSIGLGPVRLLSYNRVADKLLINRKTYDPASGKLGEGLGRVVKSRGGISDVGTKRGMGSAGLDGNVYLMGYSNWLRRLGPDLGDKPFPGGAKGTLKSPDGLGTLRLRARGVTADPAGNVYALWQMNKKGPMGPSNYLAKHSADGKVVKAKLIECQTRFISSPRLDAAGNIYVALCGRPAGKKLPDSFKGQDLGKGIVRGVNAVGANWYELMYGMILKFGPEGGSILRSGTGMAVEYGRTSRAKYTRKLFVKGAKWAFHGASPVVGWEDGGGRVSCGCESPQFDVDGFGRSFFPDALRFRCGVIDASGNVIAWFGTYGNADARGRGNHIPVLWPYCVAVSDSHVYVGDRLNRRVLAVKIGYAAEETCPVQR
jgi:hypothetical protein